MNTPYIVGPPVRQISDFFGRSIQAEQFFDALVGPQVQCVSVLGLRRAGKTSFLQYIAYPDLAGKYIDDPDRFVLVYIDMSACRSPKDFYTRLYRRLHSRLLAINPDKPVHPPDEIDAYVIESLLYQFGDRRIIVLMDEFDQLRTAAFSQEFMTELRALASVWDYELAYVTASYWDLYRLGSFVGLPLTSPFYNIFYPKPIYLSGLSPVELESLIRTPAHRVGITADDEDIAFIRRIAGSLPFFVQATAAIWLPHKAQNRLPNPKEVVQRLAIEMAPYYEQWWRNFSDVEQDVLLQVIREKPIDRLPYVETEVDNAIYRLIQYGLITSTGSNLWSDSALFDFWVREYISHRLNQPRVHLIG